MKTRATITAAALSILFVVVYGSTNWITTQRVDVGTWHYAWERWIPFVPLMIIPYMSLDLFFVAAPFLCRDRAELRNLTARIGFAILAAGACFLLFPLQLAVERPQATGWLGAIFNPFLALDAPHNLLPSLHITLRTLLVPVYHRRTTGITRVALHGWFFLIGLSTLLTHQHHVIDLAGGFALALVTMHLFPGKSTAPKARNVPVAICYATATAALVAIGVVFAPWGLLLGWPALATGIVAAAYLGIGGRVYRKCDGRIPLLTRVLLAPVLLGHEFSRRVYRRGCAPSDAVTPEVWIGGQLGDTAAERALNEGVVAVIDLTSEFSEARWFRSHPSTDIAYLSLPVLDLTAPDRDQLDAAMGFIDEHAPRGVVYVHCKIGYSRSVAVVAAYLLESHQATDVSDAIARIETVRPTVVIRPEVRAALEEFAARLRRPARQPALCGM